MTDRSGKSRQREGDDLQGQRSPQRYFKSLRKKKKKMFLDRKQFHWMRQIISHF